MADTKDPRGYGFTIRDVIAGLRLHFADDLDRKVYIDIAGIGCGPVTDLFHAEVTTAAGYSFPAVWIRGDDPDEPCALRSTEGDGSTMTKAAIDRRHDDELARAFADLDKNSIAERLEAVAEHALQVRDLLKKGQSRPFFEGLEMLILEAGHLDNEE